MVELVAVTTVARGGERFPPGQTFQVETTEAAAQLVNIGCARWPERSEVVEPNKDHDLPEEIPYAEILAAAGVTSLDELLAVGELTEIPGIGTGRARLIRRALEDLQGADELEEALPPGFDAVVA